MNKFSTEFMYQLEDSTIRKIEELISTDVKAYELKVLKNIIADVDEGTPCLTLTLGDSGVSYRLDCNESTKTDGFLQLDMGCRDVLLDLLTARMDILESVE